MRYFGTSDRIVWCDNKCSDISCFSIINNGNGSGSGNNSHTHTQRNQNESSNACRTPREKKTPTHHTRMTNSNENEWQIKKLASSAIDMSFIYHSLICLLILLLSALSLWNRKLYSQFTLLSVPDVRPCVRLFVFVFVFVRVCV